MPKPIKMPDKRDIAEVNAMLQQAVRRSPLNFTDWEKTFLIYSKMLIECDADFTINQLKSLYKIYFTRCEDDEGMYYQWLEDRGLRDI